MKIQIKIFFLISCFFSAEIVRAVDCPFVLGDNPIYSTYSTKACLKPIFQKGFTRTNNGEALLISGVIWVPAGVLTNNGNMKLGYEFALTSGAQLINSESGIIDSWAWFTIDGGKFDNYGTIRFDPQYGATQTQDNDNMLTINGPFNNYGTCRVNEDILQLRGHTFNNAGLFEVTKRGKWIELDGDESLVYQQTKGETIVDGVFKVHKLVLTAGKLSGNGLVKNVPAILSSKLTVSPGSPGKPYGKLTLIPETGITTFGGTLNIELSPAGNDELHVEGELYMTPFSKINVVVADGLKLKKGDSFTIMTGNYVEFNGADLPSLPSFLKWDIVQNGTSVKLNVI